MPAANFAGFAWLGPILGPIEITSVRLLASDLVSLVRKEKVSVICLADLPPGAPTKSRYLVKRLRAVFPDLRILMGRWSPVAMADESTQGLKEAGATLVATTIAETREYLTGLLEIPRIPPTEEAGEPKFAPTIATLDSEPRQSPIASS